MSARVAKFQACPDFKGIKTASVAKASATAEFQACPDFKGIKTLANAPFAASAFQAYPDFKGIKTGALFGAYTGAAVSSLP